MGVFFDIETALQTKLNDIAGHPYIHWENSDKYQPVIGTRYWVPRTMPERSEMVTVGALQKHQGVYQIDVYVPANRGLATLMQDLDTIYTAYNTVLSLTVNTTRVDITDIGRGRTIQDKSWCVGFIEIYYTCYAH